jgi:hypothetical protein
MFIEFRVNNGCVDWVCLSFIGVGFGHVSVSVLGFVFGLKTINDNASR